MTGPLTGLRVVEVASEHGAFAGKLLGDLGADVVVVEPPGGHHTRTYPPFVDDEPGPERSLWWWHYNTSKRGVTLEPGPVLDRLIATADIVLSDAGDGRAYREAEPRLIWVTITPFGLGMPRAGEQSTDLTVLASGGPVWMCGYDDHSLPPVRGGGNQGWHTACLWAVTGALTAVLARDVTGVGQHVDVSMHAAANVTTEAGSYEWLVAGATVQRQTGRHASVHPTQATPVVAADGRDVHSGFPPRTARDFTVLLEWMDELGIRDEFPEVFWLEMGIERGEIHLSEVGQDVEATEIFGAGREAVRFIASKLPGYDFFVGSQRRGIACGIVYSPEEVLEDEHFRARGFPVEVDGVVYPGAPFVMPASPWQISRRAPQVGEHDEEILGPLR